MCLPDAPRPRPFSWRPTGLAGAVVILDSLDMPRMLAVEWSGDLQPKGRRIDLVGIGVRVKRRTACQAG